jgi:hypothetical protein
MGKWFEICDRSVNSRHNFHKTTRLRDARYLSRLADASEGEPTGGRAYWTCD